MTTDPPARAPGQPRPGRQRAPAIATIGIAGLAALAAVGCGGGGAVVVPSTPPSIVPGASPSIAAPTAEPTTQAHVAAIEAFVAGVTSGSMTYRVGYDGHVSGSADLIPVKGAMDVAGEDFAASFTYDFSVQYAELDAYKVQVRGVDGKGYIRRGNGSWTSIKGFGLDDSYVPFKGIGATSDVRYLGSTEVDGKTLFRVSIPEALLIHPTTIPYEIRKEKVDQTTLEVLIDETGRPISGAWTLRGQARVGTGIGQLQRIVYDLDVRFAKVGTEISIDKP